MTATRPVLLRVALFTALLGLAPQAARVTSAGQVASGASIIGQVADDSGAVLPGVTVTAKSPSLQVPSVVSVTDERGEYRITPLPIGIYTVEYDLAGFSPVRHEEVRLTSGFVSKIDVVLKVGALQETVTVSGASPVVDVTSTTTVSRFTTEELELTPSSRNSIIGLIAMAPAVRTNLDTGGNTFTGIATFRTYGQENEPYTTIEGVLTTSLKGTGGSGNYYDYATIEESQVSTSGSDADMPTRGIMLGAIVKSGGNVFHGGVFAAQTNKDFESNNIDDRLRADGITEPAGLDFRWDRSAELGGRIVRDKLWFYGAFRKRNQNVEALGAFKPDGSPAALDSRQRLITGKVSYQMNQKNKFVFFAQENRKFELSVSRLRSWDNRSLLDSFSRQGKLEWQSVPSQRFVFSAQYGMWDYLADSPTFSNEVATLDRVTQLATGHKSGFTVSGMRRHHISGKATLFQPDFHGNHEVRIGADIMANSGREEYADTLEGSYRLIFSNGAALQRESFNFPVFPTPLTRYAAIYVTDSWTIQRRLTLNLGLRYAHDNGFVPGACRPAPRYPATLWDPARCYDDIQFNIWNPISPRLRAAFDLAGDGRTVIKGGWGRFNHLRQLFVEVDRAAPSQTTAVHRWADLNNNKKWDEGETNFDPNGPDFVSLQGAGTSPGGALQAPNPNEKQPGTDEFSGSIEHAMFNDLSLRVTGIYSKNFDIYRRTNLLRPYSAYNIPVTRPDPGPDGRAGTADDTGNNITYYEYPASLAGNRFEKPTLINDPRLDQAFKSIEIAAFRRWRGRWMANASYSATKSDSDIQAETVYGPDDTPNAEINQGNHTWEWMGKASATYQFPHSIMASMNYEHRSGNPWARTATFTGGILSSVTLRVEEFGSRRLPNLNKFDMRVAKTFHLPRGQNLEATMNVYNMFNANTTLSVGMNSGATFLRTTSIVPARIVEFSTRYSF